MKLTDEHVNFIAAELQSKGVTLPALLESLTDHICCMMEADESGAGFEEVYRKVTGTFGENGFQAIQDQTNYLLLKKDIMMKKAMYVIGYFAVMLCINGILFKLFHWKGANMMLLCGVVLLNIFFLPVYFYDRYKSDVKRQLK